MKTKTNFMIIFLLVILLTDDSHVLSDFDHTWPRSYNTFLCSTKLSMKFQLLIKAKMLEIKTLLAFKLVDVAFIMLINVKMPTTVGILTFMSMIYFILI